MMADQSLPIALAVRSPDLDPEVLQALTRELCQAVNRETPIEARVPEAPSPEPGAKGDPISVGAIALAFLTSGAAVALFQVCKAYVERQPSLSLEFQREDGQKLAIAAQNLDDEHFDRTLRLAQEFFGEPS